MKITDPKIIQDGEKDLINAVQEDLDLEAVRQILKDRMAVSTLTSRGGQIVVHNNQIAFRLDFDIQLSGSLLFDRQGNFIDDTPGMGKDNIPEEDRVPPPPLTEPDADPMAVDPLLEADEQDVEMTIDLPEYDFEEDLNLEADDALPALDTELDASEKNEGGPEDADINDILKESREFWEQKKNV